MSRAEGRNGAANDAIKPLPHDPKAEAAVLGAVLLENCQLERLGEIDAQDFYKEPHQHIFRAMQALRERGQPIDLVTLSHRLQSESRLQAAGGSAYLMQLESATPAAIEAPHYAQIVHELSRRRATMARMRRGAEIAEDLSAEDWADLAIMAALPEDQTQDWRGIGKPWPPGWLEHEPCKPAALLRHGLDLELSLAMPRGRVGMLAAPGGVGKSYLLLQLAVAVALGRKWLKTYEIEGAGPVAIIQAEETGDEIQRRLCQIARAYQLESAEMRRVEASLLPLGLMGREVALLKRERKGGASNLAPAYHRLHAILEHHPIVQETGGWSLVILDPASRFAGPDAETDAQAATRWIEVLETLTELPGNPTVLVSHHSTKASLAGGDQDQGSARGSSALADGVRWMAVLERVRDPRDERRTIPDRKRFRIVKSNYGPPGDAVELQRSTGGLLQLADKSRLAAEQAERDAKKRKSDEGPF